MKSTRHKPALFFSFICAFLCSSSVSSAEEIELRLIQPERILGYEQLVPFRMVRSDQEDAPIENILLLREESIRATTIQLELENSQRRRAAIGADALLEGFWRTFEARARDLGVEPDFQNPEFSPLAHHQIVKNQHVYDDENFEYNFRRENRNPVQSYLMEKMGMSAFPAYRLYHVCQHGYRQNGLEGAKLAFQDFFVRDLDSTIFSFAHGIPEFMEVKQMEAMLSFGEIDEASIGQSAVENFVAPLVSDFFSGAESSSVALVAKTIRDIGVDPTNQVAVRQALINAFTPLLDPETSRVSSILMGPGGRMREGIIAERERDGRHANGPKSMQSKLNGHFVEIVRIQLYMGIEFLQSYDFANYIATHHEHVLSYVPNHRANGYRGLSTWLIEDFSRGVPAISSTASPCLSQLRPSGTVH